MFAGASVSFVDDRRDYGELRMVSYGMLEGRMVVVIWTGTDAERRIISMRKANEREQRVYHDELG